MLLAGVPYGVCARKYRLARGAHRRAHLVGRWPDGEVNGCRLHVGNGALDRALATFRGNVRIGSSSRHLSFAPKAVYSADLKHTRNTAPSASRTDPMTPGAAIFGGLAVLITVCALLPVITSAYFGYRTGERLAIGIEAISRLPLLMSCGLFAYVARFSELSGERARRALAGLVFVGVPARCAFLGTFAGYIAMAFLWSEHKMD